MRSKHANLDMLKRARRRGSGFDVFLVTDQNVGSGLDRVANGFSSGVILCASCEPLQTIKTRQNREGLPRSALSGAATADVLRKIVEHVTDVAVVREHLGHIARSLSHKRRTLSSCGAEGLRNCSSTRRTTRTCASKSASRSATLAATIRNSSPSFQVRMRLSITVGFPTKIGTRGANSEPALRPDVLLALINQFVQTGNVKPDSL